MAPANYIEVDPKKAIEMFSQFTNKTMAYLTVATINSMTYVGDMAVTRFMRAAKVTSYEKGRTTKQQSQYLNIRTGRLMRSVKGAPGLGAGAREGLQQVVIKGGRTIEGHKGSKVPYARIHEYGGRAGRGLSANIPARPYLRPALNASQKQIHKFFVNSIRDLINKVQR